MVFGGGAFTDGLVVAAAFLGGGAGITELTGLAFGGAFALNGSCSIALGLVGGFGDVSGRGVIGTIPGKRLPVAENVAVDEEG